MSSIAAFTYNPKGCSLKDRELIQNIFRSVQLKYLHYNIPQTNPTTILLEEAPDAVVTFGPTAESLVKEAISSHKLLTRLFSLPALSKLAPATTDNFEDRKRAWTILQSIEQKLQAPPSLLEGEVKIPELSIDAALGILKLSLEQQKPVSYTLKYQDKIIEITTTEPSGTSDIYLTPFDLLIMKLAHDTLGTQVLSIKREEKERI